VRREGIWTHINIIQNIVFCVCTISLLSPKLGSFLSFRSTISNPERSHWIGTPRITNGGPERARKQTLEEREGRSCKHRLSRDDAVISRKIKCFSKLLRMYSFLSCWYWIPSQVDKFSFAEKSCFKKHGYWRFDFFYHLLKEAFWKVLKKNNSKIKSMTSSRKKRFSYTNKIIC